MTATALRLGSAQREHRMREGEIEQIFRDEAGRVARDADPPRGRLRTRRGGAAGRIRGGARRNGSRRCRTTRAPGSSTSGATRRSTASGVRSWLRAKQRDLEAEATIASAGCAARRGRRCVRRRHAAADLHLLPPGAEHGGAGGADVAHGLRACRPSGRARVSGERGDHGAAAGAREDEDPRRAHSLRRRRTPDMLDERLDGVLAVIYLVFTEGYAGDLGARADARGPCARGDPARPPARRAAAPAHRRSQGLLALMLLHDARRRRARDARGDIVLLEDQDRGLWDRTADRRGAGAGRARRCARPAARAPYAVQAAIAALHARRQPAGDRLAADRRALRRAAAPAALAGGRAQPRGRASRWSTVRHAALDLVDALAARGDLAGYHLLPAVRADLLRSARAPRGGPARLSRSARACEARPGTAADPQAAGRARLIKENSAQSVRGCRSADLAFDRMGGWVGAGYQDIKPTPSEDETP